ncbi:aminotransferase class V-fold PLP-dependent enzyme [Methanorbis rubei]|uniref:Cysteine desulfurase SufS n=1 Tax=Methanorbis rubei TaxID=3028300 RepID=A0AAE4MGK6_9EURY|nr:Cysteine desulfurase SufS [Methanocorpusculaceae archaeon Cs1]
MAGDPKPLIYLNNAATSWPKPPEVLKAMTDALSLPVFGSGRTTGTQGKDYVTLAREKVSGFLGTKNPENIIFTENATASLNMLIAGFLAGRQDTCRVLTTALDHNSVLRPLHEYQQANRIKLNILPFTGGAVSPKTVEDALTPDTKLMVMTHGSNVLGSVQNIQAIGEALQDHGVFFIVDGAQTAGHIPISLSNLPIDAFVFTGHKGLLGVSGTGGFYLKNPDEVAPTKFGGTGTNSQSLLHPRTMPEKFEAGTHNYPGLAALAAGVAFVERKGVAAIQDQAKKQTSSIIKVLAKEENIIIHNHHPDLPVISLNIRDVPNDDVGFILARAYNIIVRTGLHCAPLVHKILDDGQGSVRLSLSCFTTDEECRTAAEAILEVAENANSKIRSA